MYCPYTSVSYTITVLSRGWLTATNRCLSGRTDFFLPAHSGPFVKLRVGRIGPQGSLVGTDNQVATPVTAATLRLVAITCYFELGGQPHSGMGGIQGAGVGASGVMLAGQATQIIGLLVLFVIVYVALYKPVMRMLGERRSVNRKGVGTIREVDEDPGGPLDEPETQDGGAGPARPNTRITWFRDLLLPSTVVTVLIADQLSKYLIKANLPLNQSWPEEGVFRFTHGTNTGTAFGLFPNQTVFLIVASIFAIGFLYYFYRTQALPSRILRLAIGLQLGGAFGNLTDRLRAGSVVDFIDVGWWPIFNLADSSIVIGISLLIAAVLLRKDVQPERRHPNRAVELDE